VVVKFKSFVLNDPPPWPRSWSWRKARPSPPAGRPARPSTSSAPAAPSSSFRATSAWRRLASALLTAGAGMTQRPPRRWRRRRWRRLRLVQPQRQGGAGRPDEIRVKTAWTMLLILRYSKPLSNVALKFNLRCYTKGLRPVSAFGRAAPAAFGSRQGSGKNGMSLLMPVAAAAGEAAAAGAAEAAGGDNSLNTLPAALQLAGVAAGACPRSLLSST